jgi:leucyl aminopeptidase
MTPSDLPVVERSDDARVIHAVRPAALKGLMEHLPPASAKLLTDLDFSGRAQEMALLSGENGLEACVVGLGEDRSPHAFGDLANRLPLGDWRLEPGDFDVETAVLGFCLGAYRYAAFKPPKRKPARLVIPEGHGHALSRAASIWLARDLINAPANLLGPGELADAALDMARAFDARVTRIDGAALEREYPTVAAVGRGSARPPVVAKFSWRGSGANDGSPLVSLCGKGVCFDTGGYDLKPSSGMLRMKKDMGGAAVMLAVARMLMAEDAPIRLDVRIGCVENSVSGTAMRPLDVVRTRRGLTVEIGNTDAEGRLVLCDLLAEASDSAPSILVDCATLTGAARVALGPDLPALFANDDAWAGRFLDSGARVHDPLWRLPLWHDYDSWLDSSVADLNNVSTKSFAGAVIAALFLQRFVAPGVPWAHLDLYAWNDSSRPGRPEGGEAQAARAIRDALLSNLKDSTSETSR